MAGVLHLFCLLDPLAAIWWRLQLPSHNNIFKFNRRLQMTKETNYMNMELSKLVHVYTYVCMYKHMYTHKIHICLCTDVHTQKFRGHSKDPSLLAWSPGPLPLWSHFSGNFPTYLDAAHNSTFHGRQHDRTYCVLPKPGYHISSRMQLKKT